MELNTDFNARVSVHAAKIPWQKSPAPGVERRMLDRIGGEVARATTIVRFAPESSFAPHVHHGGEEYLVLEGVFQDEQGDFPAGTYVRNPPTSRHKPASEPGCTIFVKLWQFDLADRKHVRVDTSLKSFTDDPQHRGVGTMALFADEREQVCLERWQPGTAVELDAPDGMEILVLEGGFEESGEDFERYSWLRLPKNGAARAVAGANGARLWVKRGHLAEPPRAPQGQA